MIQHSIWHGDSRELIDKIDEPVHCVIADPPYGVDFRSLFAKTPLGKSRVRDIAGDADLEGAIELFDETMDLLLPKMVDPSDAYIFSAWNVQPEWTQVMRRLERHGFFHKMTLIWAKGWPGLGSIDANWGCGYEVIFYLKRGQRDIHHRRSAIISVDKPAPQHQCHPTEKPLALMERLIEMSTNKGDLVVDPFSGSGATVLAARNLGRRGLGIELDEKYVQASRRRLEQGVFV